MESVPKDENSVGEMASSRKSLDSNLDESRARCPLTDLSNQPAHVSKAGNNKSNSASDGAGVDLKTSAQSETSDGANSPACSTPRSAVDLDSTDDYASANEEPSSPERPLNLTVLANQLNDLNLGTPCLVAGDPKVFKFPYSPFTADVVLDSSPTRNSGESSDEKTPTVLSPEESRTSWTEENAQNVISPIENASNPSGSSSPFAAFPKTPQETPSSKITKSFSDSDSFATAEDRTYFTNKDETYLSCYDTDADKTFQTPYENKHSRSLSSTLDDHPFRKPFSRTFTTNDVLNREKTAKRHSPDKRPASLECVSKKAKISASPTSLLNHQFFQESSGSLSESIASSIHGSDASVYSFQGTFCDSNTNNSNTENSLLNKRLNESFTEELVSSLDKSPACDKTPFELQDPKDFFIAGSSEPDFIVSNEPAAKFPESTLLIEDEEPVSVVLESPENRKSSTSYFINVEKRSSRSSSSLHISDTQAENALPKTNVQVDSCTASESDRQYSSVGKSSNETEMVSTDTTDQGSPDTNDTRRSTELLVSNSSVDSPKSVQSVLEVSKDEGRVSQEGANVILPSSDRGDVSLETVNKSMEGLKIDDLQSASSHGTDNSSSVTGSSSDIQGKGNESLSEPTSTNESEIMINDDPHKSPTTASHLSLEDGMSSSPTHNETDIKPLLEIPVDCTTPSDNSPNAKLPPVNSSVENSSVSTASLDQSDISLKPSISPEADSENHVNETEAVPKSPTIVGSPCSVEDSALNQSADSISKFDEPSAVLDGAPVELEEEKSGDQGFLASCVVASVLPKMDASDTSMSNSTADDSELLSIEKTVIHVDETKLVSESPSSGPISSSVNSESTPNEEASPISESVISTVGDSSCVKMDIEKSVDQSCSASNDETHDIPKADISKTSISSDNDTELLSSEKEEVHVNETKLVSESPILADPKLTFGEDVKSVSNQVASPITESKESKTTTNATSPSVNTELPEEKSVGENFSVSNDDITSVIPKTDIANVSISNDSQLLSNEKEETHVDESKVVCEPQSPADIVLLSAEDSKSFNQAASPPTKSKISAIDGGSPSENVEEGKSDDLSSLASTDVEIIIPKSDISNASVSNDTVNDAVVLSNETSNLSSTTKDANKPEDVEVDNRINLVEQLNISGSAAINSEMPSVAEITSTPEKLPTTKLQVSSTVSEHGIEPNDTSVLETGNSELGNQSLSPKSRESPMQKSDQSNSPLKNSNLIASESKVAPVSAEVIPVDSVPQKIICAESPSANATVQEPSSSKIQAAVDVVTNMDLASSKSIPDDVVTGLNTSITCKSKPTLPEEDSKSFVEPQTSSPDGLSETIINSVVAQETSAESSKMVSANSASVPAATGNLNIPVVEKESTVAETFIKEESICKGANFSLDEFNAEEKALVEVTSFTVEQNNEADESILDKFNISPKRTEVCSPVRSAVLARKSLGGGQLPGICANSPKASVQNLSRFDTTKQPKEEPICAPCDPSMERSYRELSQIMDTCSRQKTELCRDDVFDFKSSIQAEALKIAADIDHKNNDQKKQVDQRMMQSALSVENNDSEAGPNTADEDFKKEEFFVDPSTLDLDFLSQASSKQSNFTTKFSRQSLFRAFDPIVGKLLEPNVPLGTMAENQSSSEENSSSTPRKENDENLISVTPVNPPKKSSSENRLGTTGGHTPSLRQEISKLQELMLQQEQAHQEKADLVEELRKRIAELEAVDPPETESLQNQLKAKDAEIAKLKKEVNDQTVSNRQLIQVMEEYEKTISQLVTIKEDAKAQAEKEKEAIAAERDTALQHLSNMEVAFNDIHQKYERAKTVIETLHSNEKELKRSYEGVVAALEHHKMVYQKFKQHAADKLQEANNELEKTSREFNGEMARMRAVAKKTELRCKSLEESLEHKIKELEEMTQICDELIGKVSGQGS